MNDGPLEPPVCFDDVLPSARRMSFASFKNCYSGGGCYVVGRGRTEYDYDSLADVADPIFFINDAVCLERHTRSPSFFFAHDPLGAAFRLVLRMHESDARRLRRAR